MTTGEAPTRSMGAETARAEPTIAASARTTTTRTGPRRRSAVTRTTAATPSVHSAGTGVLRAAMTTASGAIAAKGDSGSSASRALSPGPAPSGRAIG